MFEPKPYEDLNPRQKENYNFHKLSGVLADYGFTSVRLTDDWGNADFLAIHVDGSLILRVQLKGRFTIKREYEGKDLWIAFPNDSSWYMFYHDDLLNQLRNNNSGIFETDSWLNDGIYNMAQPSQEIQGLILKL